MMTVFLALIYLGGVQAAPAGWGTWKSLTWPYHFGKALVTKLAEWET